MEHLIQFAVSIDDDAIIRKVVDQATKQVVDEMTKECRRELGLASTYYRNSEFIDKVVNPIIQQFKEPIVEQASKLLAEKASRQKWYQRGMSEAVFDKKEEV